MELVNTPSNLTSAIPVPPEKPRLSESFYASGNISLYWEQNVSDYINLVYIPFCCFIGIMGNIVAFCVLVLSSLKNTTTCLYMVVISFLDTLALILNICFFVRRFPGYEIFNTWSCGFIMFLFYFTIHFDVLLLIAMTVERYIVVAYPLHAPKLITTKRTILIILSVGLFSLFLNIFNVFIRSMVEIQPGVEACSIEGELNSFFMYKIFSWIDSTIYCFLPVICLFTLNVKIIRNLEKASKVQNQLTKSRSRYSSKCSLSTGFDNVGVSCNKSSDQTSTSSSQIMDSQTDLEDSQNNRVSNRTWKTLAKLSRHKLESYKRKTETKSQQQVTVMLILVSFAFLFLATPVAILILLEKYAWIAENLQDRAKQNLAHAIADNLMYTNHAVNFILYMLSGQKFRSEFKRIMCSCRVAKPMENAQRVTGTASNDIFLKHISTTTVDSELSGIPRDREIMPD